MIKCKIFDFIEDLFIYLSNKYNYNVRNNTP